MGISTFLHLLTDQEAEQIGGLTDHELRLLIDELCKRPFISTTTTTDATDTESSQTTTTANNDSNEHDKEPGDKANAPTLVSVNKFLQKLHPPPVMTKAMTKSSSSSLLDNDDSNDDQIVKRRCDLDRCGALTAYCLSRLTKIRIEDEDEMFHSVWRVQDTLGNDVCYGPVYTVRADTVASFVDIVNERIGPDLSDLRNKMDQLFQDTSVFPSVLGGLCDVRRDRDLDYAQIHVANCVCMMRHAKETGCGFLMHFW